MNKLLWFVLIAGLLLPQGAAADGDVIIDLQGVVYEDSGEYAVVDAAGGEYAPLTGAVHFDDGLWIEAGATNLVENPSFEIDLAEWAEIRVSTSITNSAAVYDNYGIIVTKAVAAGVADAYLYSGKMTVAEGIIYTLSGYISTTGTSTRLRIYWYDASNVYISNSSVVLVNGAPTRRYALTAPAPADAAFAAVRLYFNNADALNSKIYVDAIQFEESGYLTSYCDGSLGPGYTWTGAAHASTSERLTTTVSISPALSTLSGNETWSARLQYTPQYGSTADWPDPAILWDVRGASNNNRVYVAYEDSDDAYHVYINGADRFQSSARAFAAGERRDLWLALDFAGTARLIENGVTIANYTIAALAPPTGLVTGTVGSDVFELNQPNLVLHEFALLDHPVTSAETSGYAGRFVIDNPESGGANLLEGLYSYWNFDEAGGIRYDSHGPQNLTDNNTVLTTTGVISRAALFVADNSEYLNYYLPYTPPGGYTWAGWGQLTTITTPGTLLNARDFDIAYTPTTGVYLNLVGTPNLLLPTPLTTTWQHLAVWFDGDATLGAAVNGQRYTIPYDLPYTHDSGLRFGYNGHDYLNGALDEWGMWERVLSRDELAAIATADGYTEFESADIHLDISQPSTLFLPYVGKRHDYTYQPLLYPTPTPDSPYLGIDYSGDTSWTDWAAQIEAFFAPLFIQVAAGYAGLEELRGDVCGAGFEDTPGFLTGNSPNAPLEAGFSDTPTIFDVSYAMANSLARPFGYIRAFYAWLPAINNSYNLLGANFFVMTIYFMTAGLIWISFVLVVTYSMHFIRMVIAATIQIYKMIPFKGT